MLKTYRFRMYPNDSEKRLIHKTFACYRFIYNYFLIQDILPRMDTHQK